MNKVHTNYTNSDGFNWRLIMTIATTIDANKVAKELYDIDPKYANDLATYINQLDMAFLDSIDELEPTKML